jgi:hypothetical protein
MFVFEFINLHMYKKSVDQDMCIKPWDMVSPTVGRNLLHVLKKYLKYSRCIHL